jgi:hypothetical protein
MEKFLGIDPLDMEKSSCWKEKEEDKNERSSR